MPHVQPIGVRLHVGDEFLQIVGWKILPRHDQHRKFTDQPDRLEIDFGLVGEVGIKRYRNRVRPHVTHEDGVAVGLGTHRPRGADRAARAGDVLHHDLLAERA